MSKSKRFERTSVYPLSWPNGWPRTRRTQRSKFNTTLAAALDNINDELRLFADNSGKKISDLKISSNYSLSDTNPEDAGVCLYFEWDGDQTCIAVDKYDRVQDNLQAIYHCLGAERTKLRHGGINLVKAAFRGYVALPDNSKDCEDWRVILDFKGNDIKELKKAYLKKATETHPDKDGGSVEKFQKVQGAYETGKSELKNN